MRSVFGSDLNTLPEYLEHSFQFRTPHKTNAVLELECFLGSATTVCRGLHVDGQTAGPLPLCVYCFSENQPVGGARQIAGALPQPLWLVYRNEG